MCTFLSFQNMVCLNLSLLYPSFTWYVDHSKEGKTIGIFYGTWGHMRQSYQISLIFLKAKEWFYKGLFFIIGYTWKMVYQISLQLGLCDFG